MSSFKLMLWDCFWGHFIINPSITSFVARFVGTVFLYLRKAFDTVDHKILLSTLVGVGNSLKWFRSYLTECSILFSIYARDLPKQASLYETSQFAANTSICTASKFIPEIEHQLISDLEEVSSWLRKQKLHLNAIKCCVVLFGSRPALSQSPRLHVTLDGRDLLQIQKVKYVGVVFDSHLSWNDHIEGLWSKTNRMVKMLCRLHQFVPPKAVQKQLLYSSLVLPALDCWDHM